MDENINIVSMNCQRSNRYNHLYFSNIFVKLSYRDHTGYDEANFLALWSIYQALC